MLYYANKGRALEDLIDAANARYYRQGIAVIVKQHTKWLPIRNHSGSIVTAKVEQKATVDYKGTVRNFGPVSFEAKETSSDRWYLRRLEPHQLDHLIKCREVGETCFVIIAFWKYRKFFMLSLDSYLALKDKVKSLSLQDCFKHALQIPDILRYLDPLLCLQSARSKNLRKESV